MVTATNVKAPRRQAILDAALSCFLRSGVVGTTIEGLQRESGASVGSIYHFFGSKEGVAAELYLDTLRDYVDTYLAALRNSRSARSGIEGSVRAHLGWVVTHEARARYMFHCQELEVIEASLPAIARLRKQFYHQATEWLAPHVERGHIKSLSPRLCQALWMGPSIEYARLWLARPGDGFNILDAQTTLARAAWDSVKGQ
ncbi:MAG: TetR/AcrR family transcriptional regulator [Mycobacterium sp.]